MTQDAGRRLAQDVLSGLVDTAADEARLPSVVAAVGIGGRPWWARELGDVGRQYRIGSISKTFTAALVLRLRDEGRLRLDDSLQTYVPDAPFGDRTVRSLLSHGSGIPAEPAGEWWERTAGRTWPELVGANAGRAATFSSDRRYHYSNLGFAVLGELVARLRGRPWWDCVRAELLDPLGLSQTTYHPLAGAARGTSRNPRTGLLVAEPMHDSLAMAPAGQLWSTPRDLIRWAAVLAHGSGDVVQAHTAVEMRTVQSGDPDDQHHGGYGLGLRLRWAATGTLVGHTGSMPGFLAAMFVDPSTHVGAVVMTNATTGLRMEGLAADLIACARPLGYHRTELEDEPDREDALRDLVGEWFWGNTRYVVTAVIDGLALTDDFGSVTRFLRVDLDRYRGLNGYLAGEELRVVRRGGTPWYLEAATFIYTREPYEASAPIPGGPPAPLI